MASYNWGERRVINLLQQHAGQSAGAQFLEAAREVPQPGADGNLRLRVRHRVGGRDWREPATVWLPFDNPLRRWQVNDAIRFRLHSRADVLKDQQIVQTSKAMWTADSKQHPPPGQRRIRARELRHQDGRSFLPCARHDFDPSSAAGHHQIALLRKRSCQDWRCRSRARCPRESRHDTEARSTPDNPCRCAPVDCSMNAAADRISSWLPRSNS